MVLLKIYSIVVVTIIFIASISCFLDKTNVASCIPMALIAPVIVYLLVT